MNRKPMSQNRRCDCCGRFAVVEYEINGLMSAYCEDCDAEMIEEPTDEYPDE